MDQSKEMARIAYNALSDKKGEDIKIIDITGISVLADYFIIANGNSDSQVNALVDNVEEALHKAGYPLKQREGQASGSWVLLDFGDIIVHVFESLSMCLTGKTVCSMIWRGSGRTGRISQRKSCKKRGRQKTSKGAASFIRSVKNAAPFHLSIIN